MKRVVFVAGLLGATGCVPGPPTENGLFDQWCGKSVCGWTTEQGSIARVPTWDPSEYGVELVATPTTISTKTHVEALCARFSLLGDVEPEAQLELLLDLESDGIVDFAETIPGVHWQPLDTLVSIPVSAGATVKVTKRGKGKAVLGRLQVEMARGCHGDVTATALSVGAVCTGPDACATGHCNAATKPASPGDVEVLTCAECDQDSDCPKGFRCASTFGEVGLPFLGCVAP